MNKAPKIPCLGIASESLGPFVPWIVLAHIFHGPELAAGPWYSELGLSCPPETVLARQCDDKKHFQRVGQ